MTMTRLQWVRDVLLALGNVSPVQPVLDFITAWTKVEGGGYTNKCAFNLLNTMHGNGVQCEGTIPGIKCFATYADGVSGTVAGLLDGFYPVLVQALCANNTHALGMGLSSIDPFVAGDLSVWVSGSRTPTADTYITSILTIAKGGTAGIGADVMAEYPGALSMFVNEQRTFIDALVTVPNTDLTIVIHKTGGTPSLSSLANFFQTDTNGANTHFGIDTDGTIGQFVQLKDGAAGNCCLETGHDTYWDRLYNKYGNLNTCTISIEHIDAASDNSTTPTAAQLKSSFALVLWLVQKFHVPLSNIKTHASLDPLSRARCPGNYPWTSLLEYVKSGGSGGTTVQPYTAASTDFASWYTATGLGTTNEEWHCKMNALIVHGAIKTYYQKLSIDGASLPVIGLPTTGEIDLSSLFGYTLVVQCFERAVIVFDPALKHDNAPPHLACYLLHVADAQFVKNYPGLHIGGVPQATLDALNASLTSLQADIAVFQATALVTDASTFKNAVDAFVTSTTAYNSAIAAFAQIAIALQADIDGASSAVGAFAPSFATLVAQIHALPAGS